MTSNLKVSHTKNLGMFKFHQVNRDFSKPDSINRIKRIAKSMVDDGLLPHPIVVTSKFIVVDGQHRVKAAEIAGQGIYFIVDNTIPNTSKGIFNAAKKFNKDAKVWSKTDYIHGLAEQGNESYQILEEFNKNYPMFSLTDKLLLLKNSGTKNVKKEEFADGKFEVTNLKKAELWANQLLQIRPYFEKGFNKANFVRTMLTIMEKKPEFKFDKFLHKIKVRPGMLYLCGDKKSYTEMIEELYNFATKGDERVNLRF